MTLKYSKTTAPFIPYTEALEKHEVALAMVEQVGDKLVEALVHMEWRYWADPLTEEPTVVLEGYGYWHRCDYHHEPFPTTHIILSQTERLADMRAVSKVVRTAHELCANTYREFEEVHEDFDVQIAAGRLDHLPHISPTQVRVDDDWGMRYSE